MQFCHFFLSCYLIILSTEQVYKKDLHYHHVVFVATSVNLLSHRDIKLSVFLICARRYSSYKIKSYKGDTHRGEMELINDRRYLEIEVSAMPQYDPQGI